MRVRLAVIATLLIIVPQTGRWMSSPTQKTPIWQQNRRPTFADFPVQKIYRGTPAAVDVMSYPGARTFRTQFRTQAPKGPNFAGHYTVVTWGCGSNCQIYAIVDAETGKIYGGVGDQMGAGLDRGASFRLDSTLFIADPPLPPDAFAYEDDPIYSVPARYYVWESQKSLLIYEESCHVVGKKQVCGKQQ
jgi:hypothetical protein